MTQRDVQVPTPDGTCPASLHLPADPQPRPAVIMYADAGGLREAMQNMGERLAGLGYVTLIPDFYYRHSTWAPFDMRTTFANPLERERIMGMMRSLTADMAVQDAHACADYLIDLPETSGTAIGTTGYCMGGRLSLIVAGHLGSQIAAAASFHGGNIAAADDPDSPHHRADSIAATVYVAGATNDASFPDEQRNRLEAALTRAAVTHTIETYPAAHGFAIPDTAAYDQTAAERHWNALADLYATRLN